MPSPEGGTGSPTLHAAPETSWSAAIYKEDTRVLPAQSVLPNSHQIPSQKPKPSPGPLCPSPANPAIGANHSLIVHSPICVFFPLLVLAQPSEPVGHCRAGAPTLHHCLQSVRDWSYSHPDTEPRSTSSDFKEVLFVSWLSVTTSSMHTELPSCLSGDLQTPCPLILRMPLAFLWLWSLNTILAENRDPWCSMLPDVVRARHDTFAPVALHDSVRLQRKWCSDCNHRKILWTAQNKSDELISKLKHEKLLKIPCSEKLAFQWKRYKQGGKKGCVCL